MKTFAASSPHIPVDTGADQDHKNTAHKRRVSVALRRNTLNLDDFCTARFTRNKAGERQIGGLGRERMNGWGRDHAPGRKKAEPSSSAFLHHLKEINGGHDKD